MPESTTVLGLSANEGIGNSCACTFPLGRREV